MGVNVLETTDLLELSLPKCKVCDRRLQSPILQVGLFANVCGSCCDTNIYTDAARNVDLEALLEKLYLPCNYAERGCDFEGSFDDVCAHEKVCSFHDMKCPLDSYEQCGEHSANIIDHMKSKHPDNVLTFVENHVSIKNPNKDRLRVYYLLVFDNLYFILRAKFDVNKNQILYAFYCLNYDLNIDHVKISIVLEYDNTFWNTENIHINRLRNGEFPRIIYEKNLTKLNLLTLDSFGSSDKITVKIDTTRSIEAGEINAKLNKSVGTSSWYKCTKCLTIAKNFHYCIKYNRVICCENCFKGNYDNHCNCGRSIFHDPFSQPTTATHIVIKLDQINPNSIFPCTNTGCNEQISGDNYALHTKSQCRFRHLSCSFSTSTACQWTGASINLITHIKQVHPDRANQNFCEIPNTSGTSRQLCFIKGNNTFIQTYQISNDQLIVTTNKLDGNKYGDSYKWQIYFKHPRNGCEALTSNMCTNDELKTTIDIKGYVTDGPFTFKVAFKQTQALSN